MFEEIKEIIANQFKLDPATLSRETNILTDIGADSLDLVDLLMKLEEKYGVTIKDSELEKLKTVGDIEDYFQKN
ncbi:MAG: acyl carrier protein [Clostridiales bacterium]|jgi:acyl carrier protein|nr:acyl carrier protein [Clostridiales bacterium]